MSIMSIMPIQVTEVYDKVKTSLTYLRGLAEVSERREGRTEGVSCLVSLCFKNRVRSKKCLLSLSLARLVVIP